MKNSYSKFRDTSYENVAKRGRYFALLEMGNTA